MSEDGYYSVGASICFIIACAATARMDTKHHRHRHGSSSSSSVMELEHNTDNNSCSRGEVSLYSLLRKEKNEPYTIEQQDEVAEQQRHKYYQHRHHEEVHVIDFQRIFHEQQQQIIMDGNNAENINNENNYIDGVTDATKDRCFQ